MNWEEPVATALLAAGVFFQIAAAVGLVRFPDVYCRLHVVGLTDTLGGPLVLLGAAVLLGPGLDAARILLAILFLFITSPLVGHLLSRAAMESGVKPWTRATGEEP